MLHITVLSVYKCKYFADLFPVHTQYQSLHGYLKSHRFFVQMVQVELWTFARPSQIMLFSLKNRPKEMIFLLFI